jgi:hypothetical protein
MKVSELLNKFKKKYEQDLMFAKGNESIYNSFNRKTDERITH